MKGSYYTLVSTQNIIDWWPRVAPWLLQAIGEADTWGDIECVKRELESGCAQLWVIEDRMHAIQLVVVTETILIGGEPACVLRWAGGYAVKDLTFDIGFIEAWAKARGISSIHIWGRRGWEKLFKPLGYKHNFSVLTKSLVERIH